MLSTLTAITICVLATIYICKSINESFDRKESLLAEKENELSIEVEELKKERKEAQIKLSQIKNEIKTFSASKQKGKEDITSIASIEQWLLENNHIDQHKLVTAQEFATSKNMNILSAMLTLNIISVGVYEAAKAVEKKIIHK